MREKDSTKENKKRNITHGLHEEHQGTIFAASPKATRKFRHMHIDYEISERDYVHAQSQVMMPGIRDVKVRIQVLILPFVGFAFICRSFFGGTTRLGPVLVNIELLLLGVGCAVV